MKSHPSQVLRLLFASLLSLQPVYSQTTRTWDGEVSLSLNTANNWSPNGTVAVGDTARWNGVVGGNLALTFNANIGGTNSAVDQGFSILADSAQTGSVSVDNVSASSQDLRVANISMNAGAGAFTIGNGAAQQIRVVLGGPAASHLFTNNSSATTTFETEVQLINGNGALHPLTITGSGNWNIKGTVVSGVGITKTGTGTLRLSANNTTTGAMAVNGGSLLVNTPATGTNSGTGIGTASNGVSVGASGLLGGTGQIRSIGQITVASGGTIAPGDGGIGTLTLDGGARTGSVISLASGANFTFELNSGLQSDRVALTTGAAGDFVFNSNTINFSDLSGGTLAEGAYTLFTAGNANQYTGLTIDGSGYITGGLSIGAGLSAYSANLQLTGSTILLNVIPEPASALLLGCGMVLLAGRRAARGGERQDAAS